MGQAYVQTPGRNSKVGYVIETSNSLLESYGGDFTVLALEGYTRTLLMGGRLMVQTSLQMHVSNFSHKRGIRSKPVD